ncbi:putative sensor domain DACNV-containing protein [Desulfovibrio aminophilus]|uniref:putative sensor domain DACNV-containing protein n=1 Tax=Desulfovibrio aminophilus TaxID=81425 RepID=UPI00339B46DA
MDNLISQFVTALQAPVDRGVLGSKHETADIPLDADQLSKLCSLCFWASLEMEERRNVRGTLVLCSPPSTSPARVFATPVPATIPNIVALLIASPRTPLAVQGGPAGLAIWGLLDSEPIDLLRLRIAGNGILLASRLHRVLALLHKGAVSIPVAADEASLAHLVANALGKEHILEARGNIPTKLIRVGTTMIRHGHGGTLVFVPPKEQSWRQSVRFRFSFDANSSRMSQTNGQGSESGMCGVGHSDVAGAVGRKSASALTRSGQEGGADLQRALNQSLLRRIADLSLIDGAVVMTLDLRLLGFGAKLLFGPEDFLVTTLNAVTGELCERVSLAELGGTRHQSAARFVRGNRSSDVFVVSQDGRLSMFSWAERMHGVAVVQNLEHFIWEFELPRLNRDH